MAGFFGMFDYTKEGAGVKKNERTKKGIFEFFDVYFRNIWNFAKSSLLYWLCSIFVVTNGIAQTGITYIARTTTRKKHSFVFSDFKDAVKENWKLGLVLGIINTVAMVLLALDIWYFSVWLNVEEEISAFAVLGLGVALFLLVCITFMKYYIWTMLITFKLTVKQLLKNSFHFVFINLGRNILISVVMGIIYLGVYLLATINGLLFVLAVALLLFVVPGFKACMIQVNTFPCIKKYIIDPYYKEHKGEDIEKRRALGLEIGEDEIFDEIVEEKIGRAHV